MPRRPKDIGTAAETAVANALMRLGWPSAERRALRGTYDCGDITGCPGLVFEVKGGEAAKNASDGQVAAWLAETETERKNARASFGVLVLQRRGIGYPNADRWWAIVPARFFAPTLDPAGALPVRMTLGDLSVWLVRNGYGGKPEVAS